jgi:hypothetical protein
MNRNDVTEMIIEAKIKKSPSGRMWQKRLVYPRNGLLLVAWGR